MKQYKVLCESLTGKGRNSYKQGDVVAENMLENIADHVSNKHIEEVINEPKKAKQNGTV